MNNFLNVCCDYISMTDHGEGTPKKEIVGSGMYHTIDLGEWEDHFQSLKLEIEDVYTSLSNISTLIYGYSFQTLGKSVPWRDESLKPGRIKPRSVSNVTQYYCLKPGLMAGLKFFSQKVKTLAIFSTCLKTETSA